MSIVNRDLGVSEQRKEWEYSNNGSFVTGASNILFNVPYACNAQALEVAALGVSGAPQLDFKVLRWTSAGSTIFTMGISNMIVAANVGVSGPALGWSGIATLGSSLLALQRGDVICATMSVANTAILQMSAVLVVQRASDIVSSLGLST